MIFCPQTNNALFFSSIKEIDIKIFEELGCLDDVYCNPNYLITLEKNHPHVIFSYIFLVDDDKKPIAFACIQIVDFYLESVKNNLETFVTNIKNIGRKIGVVPKVKPFKILIIGNAFVSGERGIFLKNNQDKKLLIKSLAKSVAYFVNFDQKFAKKIDAFLLKDYVDESLTITNTLKEINYHPFSVEPNMQLNIFKNWQNFDDYLQSLKTKFRVKARKALQQSADLKVVKINEETIEELIPQMNELYKKVTLNATFNLVDFNLESYTNLIKNLKEDYLILCYFLNGKLVGFLSGLINQHNLDAHFVGIDYELNKTYAIYQRMLYDYIKIAIDKQLIIINFGRTASEIKSSVGATPQNLTMYLRHKKSITNKIIKPFIQRIQPTEFHQNYPFKTTNPQ